MNTKRQIAALERAARSLGSKDSLPRLSPLFSQRSLIGGSIIDGLASLPASRRKRCPSCNAPPRAPENQLCFVCSAVRRADNALREAKDRETTTFRTPQGGVAVHRVGTMYTVLIRHGAGEDEVVADGTADEVRGALAWLMR